VYCREDVKYKGTHCPGADIIEVFSEVNDSESGVNGVSRQIAPDFPVSLDSCWASRNELEKFLSEVPAFVDWLDRLSKPSSTQCQITDTGDNPPRWVLKKVAGEKWQCGSIEYPTLIEACGGFDDLYYAISHEGQECFYGEYLATDSAQIEMAQALQYSTSLDELSPDDLRKYQDEICSLENELEIAKDTGDIDRQQEVSSQIGDVREHVKSLTMPGGKSRKMNQGDPNVKAAKAMRQRKKVLLTRLQEAQLCDVAEHVEEYFLQRSRTFGYNCGPPSPQWVLQ
jgi:hypothetical protein